MSAPDDDAKAVLDRLVQVCADGPYELMVDRVTAGRPALQIASKRAPTRTVKVVATYDEPGGWRYRWSDGEFIGMAAEVELVARFVDKAIKAMIR